MWGIDSAIILIFIPIIFVGIIAVSIIGSPEDKSWGDRISEFFGIASNAAIFFTVLALLYQVIYSEEESRRASYSELLDTYDEINQLQTDNPKVWEMLYPGEAELTELSADERLAIQYTYFLMNFFERLYLTYRDGVKDDELWKAWQVWIRHSLTTSPIFQQVWQESCGMHHSDFIAFIETNYDDGVCWGGVEPAGIASGTPVTTLNR